MGGMILIAIGSNLGGAGFERPVDVCRAALRRLEEAGIRVEAVSRWYESAPVPASDQPWFVNGVARISTGLDPAGVLALLHRVEAEFGRVRRQVNEARVLDLDLLAVDGMVRTADPVLPHPRMQGRAFVLLPLAEVAPGWRHPVSGRTVEDLIAALPPDQPIRPLREAPPGPVR